MASTTEPTALKREEEEEDDSKPSGEEEDTGAQIAPIIKLQEVAVTTGEENEDVLLDLWVVLTLDLTCDGDVFFRVF